MMQSVLWENDFSETIITFGSGKLVKVYLNCKYKLYKYKFYKFINFINSYGT